MPSSTNGGAQLHLHFWENLWVEHMPGSMESFSPRSRCCWYLHRSHLTLQHSQTLPARWPQLNPQLNRYLLLAPHTPLWDWLRTRGGMAGHQIHTNSINAYDVPGTVLSTLQVLTYTTFSGGWCDSYTYFIQGGTKSRRGWVVCQR